MINITEAQFTDLATIQTLANQVWYRTYRFIITQEQMDYMYSRMYSLDALEQQMKNGHTFIIAIINSEPVGFASFVLESNIIKVPKLYVHTRKQGAGIGQALLDAVCKIGKQRYCDQLQLNVNRYNPAVAFYKKYEMHISRVVDIPYHTFVLNDYVMVKHL